MASRVPNVRFVRRSQRTPPLILVELWAAAVVTLAVGVHEEDVAGKQDGAVCNRDYEVAEEDVFGKKMPR